MDMASQLFAVSGCDTGFGRLVTFQLADAGYRVLAGCLTDDGIQQFNQVRNVRAVSLDVTSSESITHFAQEAEKLGGLAGLLNNAGIVSGAPCELEPAQHSRAVFAVNFFGAVELTKALLPMLRKSHGRVVNVSSVAGLVSERSRNDGDC